MQEEIEQLREQLRIAVADIEALYAELEKKPAMPTPAYGQCACCGVFSDSAKVLHEAQRNCK